MSEQRPLVLPDCPPDIFQLASQREHHAWCEQGRFVDLESGACDDEFWSAVQARAMAMVAEQG